jgi:hypothetical protein
MIVVVAAVMHSGRTFSGGAAAGVVGDVGGRRDGAPRPIDCHVVMIAHACVPGRFSAVGPAGQRWMALFAVNVRGARSFWERDSPGSINHGKGKDESLTSPLSLCRFASYLLPGRALCQSRPRSFRS